jgi:hypothetical protein
MPAITAAIEMQAASTSPDTGPCEVMQTRRQLQVHASKLLVS